MSARRPLVAAGLVWIGFVAVHLLLMAGTFDVVDLEETEYGNVAVALMDGQLDEYASLQTDPSTGDGLMTGAGRRRRTIWSIEPTVLPFFAALGPSMSALKTWAIFLGGLWAALWFLVARSVAPRAGPLAAGLLFVLPIPLVQRAALSATSITAHLGSSLWHAAAVLAALAALRAEDRTRSLLWAAAAGLVAGLGLHCSFSLAPLLLAPLWLVFRARGAVGLGAMAAGALPGLAIIRGFRDPSRAGTDLITSLTGLQEGGVFREAGIGRAIESLRLALTHGAGYGRVDPETLDLHYLPLGIGYTALVLVAVVLGRRFGTDDPNPAPTHRGLLLALSQSFAAFVLMLLATGFKLETEFFDGLRYLLPLAPVPALVALVAIGRLDGKRGRGVLIALVAANALGFVLLFRPAVFPAPWSSVRGFEPWVMKAWLQDPLRPDAIAEDRLARWALWAGISEAQQRPSARRWADLEDAAARHSLEGREGADALWRGVGFGLVLRAEREGTRVGVPRGTPADLSLRLLEGMAMGSAHVGCREDLVTRLAGEAPDPERKASVWYGAGRADLYCRTWRGRLPDDADEAAFERGYADAWRLDYGQGDSTGVDAEQIDRMRIY